MEKTVKLNCYEIVGSEFCVAYDDGQKVYDQILQALNKDVNVQLSFKNVKRLTSAFLNVAIGQLYGVFSEKFIDAHFTVLDLDTDDRDLYNRVVKTAIKYFDNPDVFDNVRNRILGDKENADH